MTTILRGPLSGFGYLPPGGNTGDSLVKLSDVDGDTGWSGSSGGGISNLAESVAAALGNKFRIDLEGIEYLTTTLGVNAPLVIRGVGCNSGVTAGSIMRTANGDPAIRVTNDAQRCKFSDFGIISTGAWGIEIESGAYAQLDNIVASGCGFLFGNATHKTTQQLTNTNSWQCTGNNLRADDYPNAGIKVNSGGSTWELRNCSPRSSVDGAHGADISAPNVNIYGGQYGANNTGGRNIRFYNLRGGLLRGGSVQDCKFENVDEGEYAVDIDGESRTFDGIMLNRLNANMANGVTGTLVRYGKASYCWLNYPAIETPQGGSRGQGTIAHWTADSVGCGILVDYLGATSPIVVDAGAQNAVKVVYGAISEADVPNITVASNLTTILRDGVIEQPGIFPFHNGTTWNF